MINQLSLSWTMKLNKLIWTGRVIGLSDAGCDKARFSTFIAGFTCLHVNFTFVFPVQINAIKTHAVMIVWVFKLNGRTRTESGQTSAILFPLVEPDVALFARPVYDSAIFVSKRYSTSSLRKQGICYVELFESFASIIDSGLYIKKEVVTLAQNYVIRFDYSLFLFNSCLKWTTFFMRYQLSWQLK